MTSAGDLPQRRKAGILTALGAAGTQYDVVSTDLFDTILLRDGSTETGRIRRACAAASSLLGVDREALFLARVWSQEAAYKALAAVAPEGDVAHPDICRDTVISLGLGPDAGAVLENCEVSEDVTHLSPNRPLLDVLASFAARGTVLVATSDTPYSRATAIRLLREVARFDMFSEVYVSSEWNRTKHWQGGLFQVVADDQQAPVGRILHMGDNYEVDVLRARQAGVHGLHLPRSRAHRIRKFVGVLNDFESLRRRFL